MSDGGHVIFVSSALTRLRSGAGVAVYAAARGAIEVITRYIASEYAKRKIRANCVAPGALDTDFGGGERMSRENSSVSTRCLGVLA